MRDGSEVESCAFLKCFTCALVQTFSRGSVEEKQIPLRVVLPPSPQVTKILGVFDPAHRLQTHLVGKLMCKCMSDQLW